MNSTNSSKYTLINSIFQSKVHSYFKVQGQNSKLYILRQDHWPRAYSPQAIYQKEYEDFLYLKDLSILQIAESDSLNMSTVFDFFAGVPLRNLDASMLEAAQQLKIIIAILKEIKHLHTESIIHKNLTLDAIWYNLKEDKVKIGEYYYSSRGYENPPPFGPINCLPGDLNFLAPEQTGRMNRTLDSRSDIYSLGVIFYKLLTNTLPFNQSKTLDLVHDHLVTNPTALNTINFNVSCELSDIVLKMLAKEPDNRYQSILEVLVDVYNLIEEENEQLKFQEMDAICFSQKLYGRETETHILESVFKSCSTDSQQSVFISGHSGVGKTALVCSLFESITVNRGFFIQGKSDQYKKNIPMFSMIQALEQLADLIKHDYDLIPLKMEVDTQLGSKAALITNLIPKFEFLCGKTTEQQDISLSENSNVFDYTINLFLQIVAKQSQPLVLFLDDLQWADIRSLNLLEKILLNDKIKNILVLGAYRDNEVNESHPLSQMFDSLNNHCRKITEIHLLELKRRSITELLQDSFIKTDQMWTNLAQLIHERTSGNAFFVKQFIHTLINSNVLYFDVKKEIWSWDETSLRAMSATSNVLDLMTLKIKTLDAVTVELLTLASFLGNTFSLTELSIVSGVESNQIVKKLVPAIKYNIVHCLNNSTLYFSQYNKGVSFKFCHDKIQESVYRLTPDNKVSSLHCQLGLKLLEQPTSCQQQSNFFKIVEHLNYHKNLKTHNNHKLLFDINYQAYLKSIESSAFNEAQLYLDNCYYFHQNKEFNLTLEFKEAFLVQWASLPFFALDTTLSIDRLNQIAPQLSLSIFKSKTFKMLSECYTNLPDIPLAKDTIVKALKEVDLWEKLHEIDDLISKLTAKCLLETKSQSNLDTPDLQYFQIELLYYCFTPFMQNQDLKLSQLYTLKATELCLMYPKTDYYSPILMQFSAYLAQSLKLFSEAYEFGEQALLNSTQMSSKSLQCEVKFWHALHINHFKNDLKSSAAIFQDAYNLGIQSGNRMFCGFAVANVFSSLLYAGENLSALQKQLTYQRNRGLEVKYTDDYYFFTPFQQQLYALQGKTESLSNISDEFYNEVEIATKIDESLQLLQAWQGASKIFLLILDNKPDEAYAHSIKYLPVVENISNYYCSTIYHFFVAYSSGAKSEPELNLFYKYKSLIEKYKQLNSKTYEHLYYILQGLDALHTFDLEKSITQLQLASELAQKSSQMAFAGLAEETLARVWIKKKLFSYAKLHLTQAKHYYANWGASKKVELINQQLLQFNKAYEKIPLPNDASIAQRISFQSIIETIATITEESNLKTKQETIFKLFIMNTGAQRAEYYSYTKDTWKQFVKGSHKSIKFNRPALVVNDCKKFPKLLLEKVRRENRSINLSKSDHQGITNDPYLSEKHYKSILAVPARLNNQVIGVILFFSSELDNLFSQELIEVSELLMTQAMISLNQNLQHLLLRQSKYSIKKQNNYLNSLLNSISDAIVVVNLSDQIVSLNSNAEELCDWENQTSIRFTHVFPLYLKQNDEKIVIDDPTSILGKHTDDISIDMNHLKDFIFSVTSSKIYNANNELNGYLYAFSDISKRKALENKLLQSKKLESMGRFAGGVAHDFNNLIGGVIGAAELINMYSTNEKVREYSNLILKSADVASNLTKNLLDFSRTGKINSSNLSLHNLIITSIDMFQANMMIDKIRFKTKLSETNFLINCDKSQIINLFINLFKNASESMISSTKEVTVTTSILESIDPGVQNQVLLEVGDSGSGIPSDILPFVFDPFFSTKTDSSGTGLGLASVHGIVLDHHGSIEISSNSNGTVFHIYLPAIIIQTTENSKNICDIPQTVASKVKKVLVVDDDTLMRNVTTEMIQHYGYQIHSVSNGFEAIDYVKNNDIFAVISDYKMPKMNGEQLFYELKQYNSSLIYILYSGHVFSDVIIRMKEKGLFSFLKKPIKYNDIKQLLEEINSIES